MKSLIKWCHLRSASIDVWIMISTAIAAGIVMLLVIYWMMSVAQKERGELIATNMQVTQFIKQVDQWQLDIEKQFIDILEQKVPSKQQQAVKAKPFSAYINKRMTPQQQAMLKSYYDIEQQLQDVLTQAKKWQYDTANFQKQFDNKLIIIELSNDIKQLDAYIQALQQQILDFNEQQLARYRSAAGSEATFLAANIINTLNSQPMKILQSLRFQVFELNQEVNTLLTSTVKENMEKYKKESLIPILNEITKNLIKITDQEIAKDDKGYELLKSIQQKLIGNSDDEKGVLDLKNRQLELSKQKQEIQQQYQLVLSKLYKTNNELRDRVNKLVYELSSMYKKSFITVWKSMFIYSSVILSVFIILGWFMSRKAQANVNKLVQANKDAIIMHNQKDSFFANMSHELRTPLVSIIGMTDLLRRTTLNEKQANLVDRIWKSGDGLKVLLNDILDLSKIESGQFNIDNIEFDLLEEVEAVISMFIATAEAKGIDLKHRKQGGLMHCVQGDPIRIKQILTNLINNALKFTEKGFVTLSTHVEAPKDGRVKILFKVTDSGIGINSDEMKKLFQPFVQADNSISRRFGGTGLGLAISRHLVNMMGGTISVDSIPGKGAVFSVNLELDTTEKRINQLDKDYCEDDLQIPQLIGRVLIVDDTENIQFLVKQYVSSTGAECDVVDNGKKAVAAATKNKYDAILMDMQMPEMDGIQATKILRSKNNSTPIIALTANVMQEHKQKFTEAGCDTFLTKPIAPMKLYSALAKYLKKNNSIDRDREKTNTISIKKENNDVGDIEINYQALDNIRILNTQNEPDMLGKIFSIYKKDSKSLLMDMELSIVQNDRETLKRSAHSLKSSSATLGALKLQALCKNLEESSDVCKMGDAKVIVQQIKDYHARTLTVLSGECSPKNMH